MKKCQKCKKEFDNDDLFCDDCGEKLEEKQVKKETKHKEKVKHREPKQLKISVKAIVISIVIILIVIGGFFAYKTFSTPKENVEPIIIKSEEVVAVTEVVEEREINTIHDALISIKKEGNPKDFILAYSKIRAEFDLARKLADGLKIPMEVVDDIPNLKKKNMILFGGSCANPATELFKEIPTCEETLQNMEEIGGYIILIKSGDYNVINLQGTFDEDTVELVDMMINFEDNYVLWTDRYEIIRMDFNEEGLVAVE